MGQLYPMILISLIVTIVVIGMILWFVENYIPLNPQIRRILEGVVVFVLILWILQSFGLIGSVRVF